ncbi:MULTISPECIES: hypothetical protein [Selenomonas]|jgi:hypothetical protein|uniref:Lipoprotein n=1 Tax=Selenomonas ruminantium TaxID=971 RepID=A0A1I0X705_SELRU|nr:MULTISPECIES: hypothetical protein [Selenomonas]SFA96447.1 hypothetical protein SAMN05216587_104255 [Selenomonas ruminantium]
MNKKAKIITALGLMGVLFMGTGMQQVDAKDKAPAKTEQQAKKTSNASQVKNSYVYTSKEFGYTLKCPKKPNVIPASALYEGKEGEILVFDNEGYNIKNAWVIIKNAFDDKNVPDLNSLKEEEAKQYLANLMATNPYESVVIVNRTGKERAVYAFTAKEIAFDSTGDGKPDSIAKADNQEIVTFFRGNKGGCYSMRLMDNPELRSEAVDSFQQGFASFTEK